VRHGRAAGAGSDLASDASPAARAKGLALPESLCSGLRVAADRNGRENCQ
jgi:hypothetical protein